MNIKVLANKWRVMSPAAKASIAFMASSLLVKGVMFLTTPIFTRLLGTNEYGLIATYNSWYSIIDVFALLGLTFAGVFNVGMNDYKDSRDQYMSSMLVLCNIATVTVFCIILLLKNILGEDFLLPDDLLLIMFLTLIFQPAQVFWITRQRYEYKYKLPFLVTFFSTFISQIVAVICVITLEHSSLGTVKIWSTQLALLCVYVPIYIMLLLRGRSFFNWQQWKAVLIFALPLLPHYLAQHVIGHADRIMLTELYSQSSAGIYSVVYSISMVTSVFWSAINASLVPYSFEKLNNKEYSDINKNVLAVLLGYGVLCVGVALIAPEVMVILAPAEYQPGVYAVPPIAAVAFLSALYNVYANIEFYYKRSSYIAMSTVVAALVNVALNMIFIPLFGLYAAAYTTLVSYIVYVCLHYWGYRKCQPERVYNDRIILGLTLACLLCCELCTFLYMNNVIRYSIVAVLLIVVVWKRKFIIDVVRTLRV